MGDSTLTWAFSDPEPPVCHHCGMVHKGVSSISRTNAISNSAHRIRQCGEQRGHRGLRDVLRGANV